MIPSRGTPPVELLRIVGIILGDSPDMAFVTIIDPNSPISALRQHLSHRLGSVPDFSMTLFSLNYPQTSTFPVASDPRIQNSFKAACSSWLPSAGQTEAEKKWMDPKQVPELFGATCVMDPFKSIRDYFGHAKLAPHLSGLPLTLLETVDTVDDVLHLVVTVEKDPGLPPAYEEDKTSNSSNIPAIHTPFLEKKELLVESTIADLTLKLLQSQNPNYLPKQSLQPPPRTKSRPATNQPIPPSRDASLSPKTHTPRSYRASVHLTPHQIQQHQLQQPHLQQYLAPSRSFHGVSNRRSFETSSSSSTPAPPRTASRLDSSPSPSPQNLSWP
ncbi:hypothetical protein HDU97_003215 [Phlyctochytrium planicorne]|nr:hypothetical protein HDU97_003215 [Phlyctochytrium planicorne]